MFPQLHAAQNAWMAQIDSLDGARPQDARAHPHGRDRRPAQPAGVERHAQLAREVGATWDEILGSIMLTVPGHGLLPAVEAIPHARRGFEARARGRSRSNRCAGDADDVAIRRFASCPGSTTTTATSGRVARDGELRFWRCQDCGYYIHPPQPICPIDHSKNLATEAVSGTATLATLLGQPPELDAGPELPYIVAIVEIVEQPSVRLTTNLVNCAPDDDRRSACRCGSTFEHHPDPDGDVYLPLFEPER